VNLFIPSWKWRGWEVAKSGDYIRNFRKSDLPLDSWIEHSLILKTLGRQIQNKAGMRYAGVELQRLTLAALKQPNSSSVPTPK